MPIHPLEPIAKYPFCDFVGTEKGFAQNKRINSSSSLAMNLLLPVFFWLFHQFLFFEVKSRRWFDLWTGRWNLWWWKNFRASTQVWFSPINLCLFFFLLMSITRTKGILGATKGFSVYDYWGLFLSRSSCWKEKKVIFSLRFFLAFILFCSIAAFVLNIFCLNHEEFILFF